MWISVEVTGTDISQSVSCIPDLHIVFSEEEVLRVAPGDQDRLKRRLPGDVRNGGQKFQQLFQMM